MKIFDEKSAIKIILKNKNRFVSLAAEDLSRDISLVSVSGASPEMCESGEGIVIEENTRPDLDPIDDESFSIKCDGNNVIISAPTYLGTMWGIYTLSEKLLGISPCYLFDGIVPQKRERLDAEPFEGMRADLERRLPMVRALAEEFADVYIPLDKYFEDALKTQPEPLYYSKDGVHPNDNGRMFIGKIYAEAVMPLIKQF